MAKLAQYKRIAKEDFPPDVQAWLGKLIGPLNETLDGIVGAIGGALTLEENFSAQTKQLDLRSTSFPQSFKLTVSGKVAGVVILSAVDFAGAALSAALQADWYQDGDKLWLRNVIGIPASRLYTVTFLVIGGPASKKEG